MKEVKNMKKNLVITFALASVFLFSLNIALAQEKVPDDPEERKIYFHLYWTLPKIEEVQKDVDSYTPGSERSLYTYAGDDWGLIAVSPRARDEYSKIHDLTKWRQANPGNKFDAALDRLAASLAKKFPSITPDSDYNYRARPAEERMMKDTLKNLATLKIFKIGLVQHWYLAKNDYGIIMSRYTHGVIWARDNTDDHPYCQAYYVNLVQSYIGGGRYGTTYAQLVGKGLVGCPAGTR